MQTAIPCGSCKIAHDFVEVSASKDFGPSCSSSVSSMPSLVRTAQQQPSLATALVLSPGLPKTGKRRKLGKGEKNITVGNDMTVPWRKIKDYTSIKIIQSLQPQSMLTTSTTLPTFAGLSFNINSLDNFSSLANVFDQYRIDEIEVQLVSGVTEETISSSSVGTLYSAVDVDDATVPTTIAQLGGYSSCVMSDATVSHFHRWVPQFAVATYSGAFTSYGASKGFIDCSSPNVQHYGLKVGNTSGSATYTLQALIQYTVTFQSLH